MALFTKIADANDVTGSLRSWCHVVARIEAQPLMVEITTQDLVEAFVRPEHQDMVLECGRLVDADNQRQFSAFVGNRSVTITNKPKTPWILPKYCGTFETINVDSLAYKKISDIEAKVFEIFREFSLVPEVFRTVILSDLNVNQMAFHWPPLSTVLHRYRPSKLKKLTGKCKPWDRWSRQMLDAMEDTAATVTRMVFYGQMPIVPKEPEVLIRYPYTGIRWERYGYDLSMLD